MLNGKKKICIIISKIDRWTSFEWIFFHLKKNGFSQTYILLTPAKQTYFHRFLVDNGCTVFHIPFSGKKNYLPAFLRIISYLNLIKPQIVHCHFLDASVIGLFSAYFLRIPKRIYTRHHSFFHHDYHPKGVLLDKVCNHLSTDIIAISEIVKRALVKENSKHGKIHIVHHGFILEEFDRVDYERVNKITKRYNSSGRHPVIGVIARHIELKGIQYIIPSFKEFLAHYPGALLILANARGSFHDKIKILLQNNLPEKSYVLIPFEQDVQALYKLFDIYVHVPINGYIEAFGQTYIEALAAGIPSIFTKSGIANDFIEHHKNALVVPFRDSKAITKALIELAGDDKLKTKIVRNGKQDVFKLFDFEKMMNKLLEIYHQ